MRLRLEIASGLLRRPLSIGERGTFVEDVLVDLQICLLLFDLLVHIDIDCPDVIL